MHFSLIICFFFLVKINFSSRLETFKSGYFDIIQKDKDLPTYSFNWIKSFHYNKIRCLAECNRNFPCNIVVYNSNGLCSLFKIEALNELIDSDVGQKTIVYRSQNPMSDLMVGLTSYWPILNDLRDYMGSSDIKTGLPIDANETVGFTNDRFNSSNGAIYMNPGYYYLPSGLDFNNSFSFLVWANVFTFAKWSRIIDCGNGPADDNILVTLSYSTSQNPYVEIYQGAVSQGVVIAKNSLSINTWFHLAVVYDYDSQSIKMYVNGNLVANATSHGPTIVKRTKCFIGLNSWNGQLSSASFDDMMLYCRALTQIEVQNCMNVSLVN